MKRTLLALSVLTALSTTAFIVPTAYAHLPPEAKSSGMASLSPMLQKVMPAVVNISVFGQSDKNTSAKEDSDANSNSDDDDADQNSNDNGAKPTLPSGAGHKFISLGSGVIVDAVNGYIVTNAHVVKDARIINVTLGDSRQTKAKVIGFDTPSDIAILQIKEKNLTALPLADSQNVKVGDFVVAIGNPFGLNQTVTSGIVSGLQRTNLGIDGYENFIQTDAPINPGNSGGALVNMSGELIGINTAIVTPDGGNIGIGFAVPTNVVKSVMTQLLKYGSVHRGLMGVMVQAISPDIAAAFGSPNLKGGLIAQVAPLSPAGKAGIQAGDIIQKINGQPINSATDVSSIVGLLRMGSKIDLEVLRNNKLLSFTLITASPSEYQKEAIAQNPLLFGVNLRDFNQVTAVHGLVQGVQITGISQDSPLWRSTPVGLRPGDIIISANHKNTTNTADLVNIAKHSRELLLNVYRENAAMFVVVKIGGDQ